MERRILTIGLDERGVAEFAELVGAIQSGAVVVVFEGSPYIITEDEGEPEERTVICYPMRFGQP